MGCGGPSLAARVRVAATRPATRIYQLARPRLASCFQTARPFASPPSEAAALRRYHALEVASSRSRQSILSSRYTCGDPMETTTTNIEHPGGTTIVTTTVAPAAAATEATLISGTAISKELRGELAEHVKEMQAEHGITPGLAVVLVGDRPDSATYVRMKKKAAAEVGFHSVRKKSDAPPRCLLDCMCDAIPGCAWLAVSSTRSPRQELRAGFENTPSLQVDVQLSIDVTEAGLIAEIKKLNEDKTVHAILVRPTAPPSHTITPLPLSTPPLAQILPVTACRSECKDLKMGWPCGCLILSGPATTAEALR